MTKQFFPLKPNWRLAVLAAAPLLLAACGGGGGGGGAESAAATTSPSATGPSSVNPVAPAGPGGTSGGPSGGTSAGTPSGTTGGAAGAPNAGGDGASSGGAGGGTTAGPTEGTATGLGRFEPVRVGTVSTSAGPDEAPATSRLANGNNVVVWLAQGQVLGRFTNAAGNLLGDAFVVSDAAGADLSVAALPDGGFAVAWVVSAFQATTPGAMNLAVQLRRFTPGGQATWSSEVSSSGGSTGAGGWNEVRSAQVVAAADGDLVVGWVAKQTRLSPYTAYLQRVSGSGQVEGAQVLVAGPSQPPQLALDLAPLPDGSVLAGWVQQSDGAGAASVYTRRFGADSQASGAAVVLAGSEGANDVAVLALPGGNAAVASLAPPSSTLRVTVLSPSGAEVGPATALQVAEADSIDLVALGGNGFALTWQVLTGHSRGTNATLWMRPHDNTGAATGEPVRLNQRAVQWVSPTTGAQVGVPRGASFAGTPQGSLLGAFHRADDVGNTYVFGY